VMGKDTPHSDRRMDSMLQDDTIGALAPSARTEPYPAYVAAPRQVLGPSKLVCVVALDRPAREDGEVVHLACRELWFNDRKVVPSGEWSVRFEIDLTQLPLPGGELPGIIQATLRARCNGQSRSVDLPVGPPGRVRPIYVPITVGVPDAVEGGGTPFAVTVIIQEAVVEAEGWPVHLLAVPSSGSAGAPFADLSHTGERTETILQNRDCHTLTVTTAALDASWFGRVNSCIRNSDGVDHELSSGEFEVYP
jgi:hypothetical protein